MKTLLFALILFSSNLQAQIVQPNETIPGKMLNASIAAFQVADSDTYAELFMKKAELIDASGAVMLGRTAIVEWHEGLMNDCAQAHTMTREVLTKHMRSLRPDLAVMVVTTRITCGEQSGTVAYNCLLHRIDGKWYIETCAIVPVQETALLITGISEK